MTETIHDLVTGVMPTGPQHGESIASTEAKNPVRPAVIDDPFAGISGQPEAWLREPVREPVAPSVVAKAQEALDGKQRPDGSLTHVLSHTFSDGQEDLMRRFVRQLRHAGDHTDPVSVVTVKVNPQGDNPLKVSWRASRPRRKRPAV